MADRTLHVHIDVHIDGETGDEWEVDHTVIVPPDYAPVDIAPFVQHESERALAQLQQEAFGFSRQAMIIAQYDTRVEAVRSLIADAPHSIRNHAAVLALIEVLDLDNDDLFARWGDRTLEG